MKPFIHISSRIILAGACVIIGGLVFRASEQPDGPATFKQRCSMCHGADGKGFAAIKTPDFTDPKWQESITDKEMIEVIKNGKKGTPMPAFGDKLKEEEILSVVAHIRSLNSEKSSEKSEKSEKSVKDEKKN